MKTPRLALAVLALGASLLPLVSAGALSAPEAVALRLPSPNSGLNQGYLPFQSCSSLGNCAIAGIYLGSRGFTSGVIDDEVKGTWRAPIAVTPPNGYIRAKGVTMQGLSCPSDGNCVALGQYNTAADQLPFVKAEINGAWHPSVTLSLPVGALPTGESATPRSITCVTSGNCAVVGTYTTNATTFSTQGFMVTEIHGVWRHAVTLSLPPGSNANPLVSLAQVACWSTTNCLGVGSYVDDLNVTHAIAVSEVNGVWKRAVSISLPGNASAFAGAQFNEVNCVSAGSCMAAGTYNTNTGAVEPLVALSVSGVWDRAHQVTLPHAAKNPESLLYGFKGVACFDAGNCSFGGQFLDSTGRYQGFFDNVVNGNVQHAQVLPLPAGALQSGHNGGVVSISCPALDKCVAGAAYLNAANQYSALLVSEVNSTWSIDTTVTLPGNAPTVGIAGGVYSVQCFATNSCQVSGSYQSGASRYDGFSLLTGS